MVSITTNNICSENTIQKEYGKVRLMWKFLNKKTQEVYSIDFTEDLYWESFSYFESQMRNKVKSKYNLPIWTPIWIIKFHVEVLSF